MNWTVYKPALKLVEGQKVRVQISADGMNKLVHDSVVKVTAKQVILESGTRINRSNGVAVGEKHKTLRRVAI